jgi:hypothetical protein
VLLFLAFDFIGGVATTIVVLVVRAHRARNRRAEIQTGGTATCRAVLSVGDRRFRTGVLQLSGDRAIWHSRSGDEAVELSGGRVLAAGEALDGRARDGDVLLRLSLPGPVAARLLVQRDDTVTLRDVLARSEAPRPGAGLPPFHRSAPRPWALVCLGLAGLWLLWWVWVVVGGETVTATVTGGDGEGTCEVTWSAPAGARNSGEVDCDDEPAGSSRTVWVLGWPVAGDPEDPAWTVGGALILGSAVALPGAVSLFRSRWRPPQISPSRQYPLPEPPRVRVPDQDVPGLPIDDARSLPGESPTDTLRRLAPYAARQLPADGWEHAGLPAGDGPPQTLPRVLRAIAGPCALLAGAVMVAWLLAGSWYVLATTTTGTADGTSTGVSSTLPWPLPDDVTVRFRTPDRVEHVADVDTLRSLPEDTPVTVEYSVGDPDSARLVGPDDGLGRGLGISAAALLVSLLWTVRKARTATAALRATRAAAESPPNAFLGLLTADGKGRPVLLACSPGVAPLRFLATPLETPLPHGIAALFAASPGVELRLRGRLAAGEFVVAEVGGKELQPAGRVWAPEDEQLVSLLDSVGALVRATDDDEPGG